MSLQPCRRKTLHFESRAVRRVCLATVLPFGLEGIWDTLKPCVESLRSSNARLEELGTFFHYLIILIYRRPVPSSEKMVTPFKKGDMSCASGKDQLGVLHRVGQPGDTPIPTGRAAG